MSTFNSQISSHSYFPTKQNESSQNDLLMLNEISVIKSNNNGLMQVEHKNPDAIKI